MAHRVVVVGGGLAGLASAHHLLAARPDLDVLVLEGSERVGGKTRLEQVAGVDLDVGAESVLARSEAARDLFEELGLTGRVVHPEPVPATIWSRGTRHRVPVGTYMGIPGPACDPTGLLDEGEAARAGQPAPFAPEGDVSVGEAVATVYGRAVVERIVEPLLGGVYAGRVDELSLEATMPALWSAMADGASLPEAVSSLVPAPTGRPPAPRVMGLRGGIASLAEGLSARVTGAGGRIETGTLAREIHRTPTGWSVVTGPTIAPREHGADTVVLATPAAPTGRLLRPHTPAAADALAGIEYASMVVITMALPRARMADLEGSGFLAPAVDGGPIKASTFSTTKWAWVREAAGDLAVLRASAGRAGEARALQRGDDELTAIAHAEVSRALATDLPDPVQTHVQRWGGGLPQYAVGHVDRVRRVRDAVDELPGLEVTGAAYDGVGIAAVLAGARDTARAVLTRLDHSPRPVAPSTTKESR
ncbi:protoporphyrinogen oxidase [Janibacter corallicola]|uniref:protoporphyrinogen oxidase n=1 Tax=Janibacter corallicola TaxID=415212 RepID=UPI0009FDA8C8|nr:protoporphyrinogen oxidase [Janibacter corallicola]